MRRFDAVVAVVVLDEVDLISRQEDDVRQHAKRTGLSDDEVGAVVVGRDGRQGTAAAAAAAATGRRLTQPTEVVTGIRKWSVGADREVTGVQL